MTEIRHRQQNGSPEIEYAEIYNPDDRYLGTGNYKIMIKKDALLSTKVISSIMINPPVFQISVNLNPATHEIPVLLGRADGSEAVSEKTFRFPVKINLSDRHEFEATFSNWEITGLCMDGTPLVAQPDGVLPFGSPLPEHKGTMILTIPSPYFDKDVQEKILNEIFDLTKYFTFYQINQGNTEINIYRNTEFQIVYHHYNPTFGLRELTIDFADAEREGARAIHLIATWSASKTCFYVGLISEKPKFEGLRSTFVLSEDKLKLIRENIEVFEELIGTPGREEETHQFLKSNSVMLGLTSIIEPISKFQLGDDYVTDFVIREVPDGYVFIEIERPNLRLFKKTKRNQPPERTQEFNHAIEQLENWKTWIAKNHSYISSKLKGVSPTPVCWLIAGRRTSISSEERERLAEMNREYKSCHKIFTYDDLLDRMKAVMSKVS